MNKRQIGAAGEEEAAVFLERRGFQILERNFRSRYGEIDIIGYHKEYLVFCEVKYRKSRERGLPEEAVNFYKQRRICKAADFYRYIRRIPADTGVRYDVVAIEGNEIRWHQGAFSHIY